MMSPRAILPSPSRTTHPIRPLLRRPAPSTPRRTFHATPRPGARGGRPVGNRMLAASPSSQAQLSPTAAQKQLMNDMSKSPEHMQNDFGLLRPTLVASPEYFASALKKLGYLDLRGAWKMIWSWVKCRATMMILTYQWRKQTFGRLIPYFDKDNRARYAPVRAGRSELVKQGLALQEQLYRAYADGDKARLDELCVESLAKVLKRRIKERDTSDVLHWLRARDPKAYVRSRTVQEAEGLKFKGVPVAIQQAVIQIVSSQELRRGQFKNTGDSIDWQLVTEGGTVEYLVIQRRILAKQPEDWRVFGTVEPTTDETLDKVLRDPIKDLYKKMDEKPNDNDTEDTGKPKRKRRNRHDTTLGIA